MIVRHMRTLGLYFRISAAAIERYQLEKPIRDMIDASGIKIKGRRPPFGTLLNVLTQQGWVTKGDQKLLNNRYKTLSNFLHGRTS